MEMNSFLHLMKQPLLVSNFSSASSSPLLAFIESRGVRAFLWIRLWLKGMLWAWSVQATETFLMSPVCYHSYAHWSSLFNCLKEKLSTYYEISIPKTSRNIIILVTKIKCWIFSMFYPFNFLFFQFAFVCLKIRNPQNPHWVCCL